MAIRHYEELGLISSAPRQAGSRTYRDYDLSVLKTIENIRALQRLGLPLNEIAPIFKISAAGYTQEQLMQFLEERLNVIRGKIAELNEIEGYISGKLNRLREESKPSTGQRLAKKKKPITRRASSKHAS